MISSWIIFSVVTIAAAYAYINIARSFGIVDIPNSRSSHQHITTLGIGVILPLLTLAFSIFYNIGTQHFIAGILIAGLTGFYDDLKNLNTSSRVFIYFISVLLCYHGYVAPITGPTLLASFISLILITGIVNTFNFMDGINGITLNYSLCTVVSIFFIQNHLEIEVITEPFFHFLLISGLVLLFLNFRKKALVFLGDGGSVYYGLICSILVLKLIFLTGDMSYMALLLLYGVDSVGTIFLRLFRSENIFKPHRLHIYQILANEKKWGHLPVTMTYFSIQLLINVLVFLTLLKVIQVPLYGLFLCCSLILLISYLLVRKFYFYDLKF